MYLRRLTGLARQDLVDEISQLRLDIAYYEDLLAHEEKAFWLLLLMSFVRFPTVTLTSVTQISDQTFRNWTSRILSPKRIWLLPLLTQVT